MPPIRQRTALRLEAARRALKEPRRLVAQFAHPVGHPSEEVFSRAFKRGYGVAPAHRREQRAA